jgi:hypothetical protein
VIGYARDLDRGSVWFGEINDQLKDTSIGIICLTQENKNRPWILFEAGALIKGLTSNRVCTFLIDLQTRDIEDPLAQFNHTFPTKNSMLGLVETLNSHLGEQSLDHRILQTVFETYWPQFEQRFHTILESVKLVPEAKPRNDSDILTEILENTRNLSSRILRLESKRNAREISNNISPTDSNKASLIEEWRHMIHRGLSFSQIIEKIDELHISDNEKKELTDMASRMSFFELNNFFDERQS